MGRQQGRSSAPLTPWPLLLVLRRWRAQWRLQAALLLVATTAAAALCALVPLVQATEPAVVRASVGRLPASRTAIDVQVVRPGDPPEVLRRDLGRGLAGLLRTRGAPPSAVVALSQPLRTRAVAAQRTEGGALVYAAAADSPGSIADLVSGAWPRRGSRDAVLPQAAAVALGLHVGDRLPLASDEDPVGTLRISGIYRPRADAAFWQLDPLRSSGEDPAFTDPAIAFGEPGEAFGPLIAARGSLDAPDLPLLVVALRFQPDLRSVPVADLRRTAARIAGADDAVVQAVGSATLSVGATSAAPEALRSIADGLDATRSLVLVGGGLLAVLTATVLLVAARLLAASRAGEQRVLVERGAGRRHVIGLAAAEAVGTGALIGLVAPAPAVLLYRLLVDVPGARAAGVPQAIGVSPAMWSVAGGFALLTAAVLLVAALRPPVADRAGRGSRLSRAARSGADVAVLAVALLLLQRLLSDPGPPTGAALAAPVLLLTAAALVGLRLVSLTGRALEPLAARTRSAVVAIAAFELGRRAQRSAAAVMVVALGLGCGAFALAQLRTWQQSQRDQAVFAAGVPVRAAAVGRTAPSASRVRAADPAAAIVLRTQGLVTGDPGAGGDTASVGVLALPAASRALLARTDPGAGGSALRTALTSASAVDEPVVPAGAERLRVRTAAPASDSTPPAGSTVSALVRTPDGSIVRTPPAALGRAGADLPLPGARPMRLVGLRFDLPSGAALALVRIRVEQVSALGAPRPVLPKPAGWSAGSTSGDDVALDSSYRGFADLTATVQPGGDAAVVQLLAWVPSAALPVALDRAAAAAAGLTSGASARLVLAGSTVTMTVQRVVGAVPGAAPVPDLVAGTAVAASSVLVVDRERLQRALVQQGGSVAGLEQEWWLAPRGSDGRAVARLGRGVDAVGVQQLTARFEDGPLRVAVRPALLLLGGTAGLLTLVAFAVQTAAARHDRRFDLAQLRAAGATRSELARLDVLVAAVLIGLGALVGLPVGAAIAAWAGPRLVTGPDGGAPVPAVAFVASPVALAVLVAGAAALLLAVVVVTALAADRGATARLIRIGGEP